MKIATLSLMTPLRVWTTQVMALAVYLGWWCMALALQGRPEHPVVRWLLLPAALLVVVALPIQLTTLGAAMRVLSSRRTPSPFSRGVLRDGLLQLGLGYVLLAGSAALHFTDPRTGVAPLAAAALLSVLACAVAIATLAARRLPTLVGACVIVLALLAASGKTSPAELIAPFNTMNGLALACLSLLWPLATVIAAMHPATPARFGAWMAHSRPDRLWQRLATLTRRVTFLNLQSYASQSGKPAFGGTAQWWAALLVAIFLPRLVLTPVGAIKDNLGAMVDIGIMLVALCDAVPALDLHWRGVLAPGGWRTGAIGTRLWRAGALVYGTMVLLCFLGLLAFDGLFGHQGERGGLHQLAVGLAETFLLMALAVVVRGGVPHRWAPITMVALSPVMAAWFGNQLPEMVALRTSWAYVPLMLVLTAAGVLLANRLWTIDKLMAAARS